MQYVDASGVSALIIAAVKRHLVHLGIVKALLAADADMNRTQVVGAPSLYMSSQNGRSEVVKVLLSGDADKSITANWHCGRFEFLGLVLCCCFHGCGCG